MKRMCKGWISAPFVGIDRFFLFFFLFSLFLFWVSLAWIILWQRNCGNMSIG